jgi:hypothetical protein
MTEYLAYLKSSQSFRNLVTYSGMFACCLAQIEQMLEAVGTSETSVNFYHTARRSIPRRQSTSHSSPWEPELWPVLRCFVTFSYAITFLTKEVRKVFADVRALMVSTSQVSQQPNASTSYDTVMRLALNCWYLQFLLKHKLDVNTTWSERTSCLFFYSIFSKFPCSLLHANAKSLEVKTFDWSFKVTDLEQRQMKNCFKFFF